MNTCLKCSNTLESEAIYGLHKDCFTQWFGQINTNEFTELDPKRSSSALGGYPELKKQVTIQHH